MGRKHSSVKLTSGGTGQAGSEYEVITGFAGRDMKLSYRTVEVDRPSKVVRISDRHGEDSRHDRVHGETKKGCEVKYDARIPTNGLAKVIDPLFSLIFKRVGDRAAASLRKALARAFRACLAQASRAPVSRPPVAVLVGPGRRPEMRRASPMPAMKFSCSKPQTGRGAGSAPTRSMAFCSTAASRCCLPLTRRFPDL